MTDKTEELQKRTMQFALHVVRLFRSLPSSAESRVAESRFMGQQLLRSGISVAANYRAVCKARSAADFISKLGIVEEEIDESVFWLKFLVEAQMMPQKRMSDLVDEAKRLAAIFAASRLTAKQNNRQSEVGNRKSRGGVRP